MKFIWEMPSRLKSFPFDASTHTWLSDAAREAAACAGPTGRSSDTQDTPWHKSAITPSCTQMPPLVSRPNQVEWWWLHCNFGKLELGFTFTLDSIIQLKPNRCCTSRFIEHSTSGWSQVQPGMSVRFCGPSCIRTQRHRYQPWVHNVAMSSSVTLGHVSAVVLCSKDATIHCQCPSWLWTRNQCHQGFQKYLQLSKLMPCSCHVDQILANDDNDLGGQSKSCHDLSWGSKILQKFSYLRQCHQRARTYKDIIYN